MFIAWYSRVNILFMAINLLLSVVFFILWRRKIIRNKTNCVLEAISLFILFDVFVFTVMEVIKLFAILGWYANFVETHILANIDMVMSERLYTIIENSASFWCIARNLFYIWVYSSTDKDGDFLAETAKIRGSLKKVFMEGDK